MHCPSNTIVNLFQNFEDESVRCVKLQHLFDLKTLGNLLQHKFFLLSDVVPPLRVNLSHDPFPSYKVLLCLFCAGSVEVLLLFEVVAPVSFALGEVLDQLVVHRDVVLLGDLSQTDLALVQVVVLVLALG